MCYRYYKRPALTISSTLDYTLAPKVSTHWLSSESQTKPSPGVETERDVLRWWVTDHSLDGPDRSRESIQSEGWRGGRDDTMVEIRVSGLLGIVHM